MQAATSPVTRLSSCGKPRRPIVCSLCGHLLGAWYQYQTTCYPYFVRCTAQCERLLAFAECREHVPRDWRGFPDEWRAPLLASAMIEQEAKR